ncbi:protein of unknown function [Taphrina deformans PYCC 5710]|uniref:DNA mismatch repair protein MSH5 n=1 Tax=Taphrina deformans (strain PYCC 5710 / ATCC 11124 / CBS 356.35 / IMI 108563 / JCM 9778 / NBRC 8474) TaxID=1097556 RepID=R4XJA1_TAPDE|nr:protein of unknown function [Taphrina deformans PYCC 5710]|eukprot:CCG84549.1 protein of unknown function [Taphrina deformans PYCC 5710]
MQESKQKRKDNPSLFGIVNRCRTTSGRALLKHWFLAPTTDILVIETRHDAIECLISPYNAQISDKISQIIGKCADMHNALQQLQAGQHGSSRGGVWQVLLNFAFHAVKVLEKVEEMRGNTEIDVLRRICASFDVPSLQRIGALINDVIDFDGSEAEERIMVKRLVDEELDRHKDVYDSLEEVLNKVCSEIAAMIPNQYEDVVHCVYLPQLGFLTVMPAQETDAPTEPDQILPVWQSEEWTIHFSTEKSVYFKSEHMAELDEYFGDVHSLVVDREIELLYQLQLRILEHSQLLLNCSEIIAELDCLLAYALAAKKYKWVRPQMTDQNVLSVQEGRHPLYELVVDVFVPNDVHVIGRDVGEEPVNNRLSEHENENVDDIPNLILMTGANFSGKSVYLKQMALIVYMAHIGSFVPAKSALVGITDRILTRLMTRRSVTQAESSFMCDLQQVSVALQLMTARSLLVIDEFGKGTEACDGAALFGALVEHLTDANNIRPRSLVSTHFHEVLRPEYMRMNSAMSLKHMEIIINKNAEQIKDQIAHLYRVADGPTLSSFGINCAALGGVPDHILARAQQLLEIQARGDCLTEALSVLTDKEREELKEAEGLVRRFAAWDVHAEPVENVRARLAEIIAG